MKRIQFILLISILLFGSCQRENSQIYPIEFEEYVNEFFIQANLRGQNLNLEDFDFSLEFGIIEGKDDVGFCYYRNHKIIIDKEYWDSSNKQEREFLIFHELGHCLLERDHRNEKTMIGECFSFMRGAENDFDCSFNLYSKYWRVYYLNELFSAIEELPDWYMTNQEYGDSFTNNEYAIQIQDSLVEMIYIDSIELNQTNNFLVEIEFMNWGTEENRVLLKLGNLTFKSCNICAKNKVEIYSKNDSKIYFTANDINFNSSIKLSMIKNKDVISFFINEIFVHSMESELLNGNLISTNDFDDLLNVNVNILLD